MKIPTLAQAQNYLQQAESRNPGPWVSHSIKVAEAGQILAQKLPGMDPQAAYILGLLHDIGRGEGVTGMRHVLDGYKFLLAEGYPDCARISLTHSFAVQDIRAGSATWDCTPDELQFVQDTLQALVYDDYDRLFQLCDSLALPHGYCLLEKRWVDVAMRYNNLNAFTVPKWRAIFEIKQDFEKRLGRSIYHLLPGIVEGTFGW